MPNLTQRIMQLSEIKGITINKIETSTGIAHGSIRKWNDSIPSGDKILRVANYFDVSMDYLMGNTDNPQSHKTEVLEAPIAAEIAKAMKDFSDELSETVAKRVADANKHVKGILVSNGITPPDGGDDNA